MFLINILIMLIFAYLALISRKYYSKYKGNRKNALVCVFMSIGEWLFERVKKYINYDKLGRNIRRIIVASGHNLDREIKSYVVKSISVFVGILFGFNLLSICVFGYDRLKKNTGNTIWREGYEGDTIEKEIYLNEDGKEEVFLLEIDPQEYDLEQFVIEAELCFEELEKVILGENEDAANVKTDLVFPSCVEPCFLVEWKSLNPEIVSSSGRVLNESLKEDMVADVLATITYHDMSLEHNYSFVIKQPIVKEKTKLELICDELSLLEKNTRECEMFVLPNEIEGTKVSLTKRDSGVQFKIIILGLVLAVGYVLYQRSALVSKGKERDELLLSMYPHFVNRLWLLLGAGMTTKAGIKQIISESDHNNLLIKELEYTLNQIDAGDEEAKCYEQLGSRIGLQLYSDLFEQLSLNLVIGSKDLLKVMENEVNKSMDSRKESVRKKGEKISTKLLFPMALMLAVVMILMIVPAFFSLGEF